MQVKFKRLSENAIIPHRAHEGDAGWDVYVPAVESAHKVIEPGETYLCKLGFAIQFPEWIKVVNDLEFKNNGTVDYGYLKIGLQVEVRSRSGLAKRGLIVANAPGTIDSIYTGEVGVLLHNQSDKAIEIHPSDKIAQLVLMPYFVMDFIEVGSLEATDRGEDGFGSTGR